MSNIHPRTVNCQHRKKFTTVATARVSNHSRVRWSSSPALAAAAVMLLSVLGIRSASAGPTIYLFSVVNPSTTTAQKELTLLFSTNILVDNNKNPMGVVVSNLTTTALNADAKGKGIDFSGTPLVNPSGMGPTPAMGSVMAGVVSLVPGPTMFTGGTFTANVNNKQSPIFDPKLTIVVGKKDNGEVDITNTDTQTVYFENVDADTNIADTDFIDPSTAQLDDDLNNQLYALDSEPNFSLAPGETETFAFGPDLGDNYTAVVFTASFDPRFSNSITEGFASDVEIPEPPAWTCLALCVALTLVLRRRNSVGSPG